MAVDEINPIIAAVPTALLNRTQASSPRGLSDILRPVPVTVVANQELTPVQQAALLVNETLQDLNFAPLPAGDALMINETNPALTLLVETIEMSPAQQAAVTINQTLQDLTTPLPQEESPIAAITRMTATQNLPSGLPETTLTPVANAAGLVTNVATQGLNLTSAADITPQVSTSSTEATVTNPEFVLTRPTAQPILDRNPIAVPVYEIRDPNPAPPGPKPIKKEIPPPHPFGRVRPVDRLVLRQEWEKRKEDGQKQETPTRPPLAEVSIRQMVSQANEDLAANGLPLRLVLAKNSEGYSLDIYDCSDNEVCRLAQEVHLDLSQLLTILDNIQHETGIIVNIMT